ncbi:hypothetical protein HPB50_016443 [Hyalomma asiaticum]|uniref:Uncharacterized protein n=1 Tax=Hyalomma asiaticum TaxID=266040 RepID=A0ACB7SNS8_HYAAI|nr:hypothetical protein HPB50_016443 [Hyalomma asiaticum]
MTKEGRHEADTKSTDASSGKVEHRPEWPSLTARQRSVSLSRTLRNAKNGTVSDSSRLSHGGKQERKLEWSAGTQQLSSEPATKPDIRLASADNRASIRTISRPSHRREASKTRAAAWRQMQGGVGDAPRVARENRPTGRTAGWPAGRPSRHKKPPRRVVAADSGQEREGEGSSDATERRERDHRRARKGSGPRRRSTAAAPWMRASEEDGPHQRRHYPAASAGSSDAAARTHRRLAAPAKPSHTKTPASRVAPVAGGGALGSRVWFEKKRARNAAARRSDAPRRGAHEGLCEARTVHNTAAETCTAKRGTREKRPRA